MKIDHIYFKLRDWTNDQAFHAGTLDLCLAFVWWLHEGYAVDDISEIEVGIVFDDDTFVKLGTMDEFHVEI